VFLTIAAEIVCGVCGRRFHIRWDFDLDRPENLVAPGAGGGTVQRCPGCEDARAVCKVALAPNDQNDQNGVYIGRNILWRVDLSFLHGQAR